MFPTFTPFTARHPRLVALIGIMLFILGALLWTMRYSDRVSRAIDDSLFVRVPIVTDEQNVTKEDKMQILESLKSDTSDSMSFEEKMQILESLKSNTSDDISPEEKMKILDSLR